MNDASAWKSLIWDVAVKAALALVFAGAPWLGAILGPIVMLFTDKLFGVFSQFVAVEKIRLENEEHHKAYTAQSIRLRQIAKDGGIDSDAFKKARQDAQAALSKYVQYGAA